MPYLKRFIDNMLGIWCGSDAKWAIFKASLNCFGKLEWICSERLTSVMFLDLTITIDAASREIHTKTYQKPKKLHLYIPVTSAHPEACFQGTVMGNVIRYWKQNTSIKDSRKLLAQFSERLYRRGHETRKVTEWIEKATKYIDEGLLSRSKSTKMTTTNERTLFLHWKYHPRDITQQTLHRLYDETLAGKDGFDKMTICYSRPRNLREALTITSLSEREGERVSDLLNFLDPSGIREFENNELKQKNYEHNSSRDKLPSKLGMSAFHYLSYQSCTTWYKLYGCKHHILYKEVLYHMVHISTRSKCTTPVAEDSRTQSAVVSFSRRAHTPYLLYAYHEVQPGTTLGQHWKHLYYGAPYLLSAAYGTKSTGAKKYVYTAYRPGAKLR
jgi:hypothetical protein